MVQKHCCIDLVTINSPLWMVTSITFAYPNEGTWWNWAVAEVFKILVCQLPLPIQTFTIHQVLGNTIIILPFRSNHCGACDTLCRQSAFSGLPFPGCFVSFGLLGMPSFLHSAILASIPWCSLSSHTLAVSLGDSSSFSLLHFAFPSLAHHSSLSALSLRYSQPLLRHELCL